MASALAHLRHEWHMFRHDVPGARFINHRDRMKKQSRTHAAMAFALGVLLLATGVVLLFIPGPGTPLIVFGLALVATHWKWLAQKLDRAEPAARQAAHRAAHWWQRSSHMKKAAVVTGSLLVASGFLLATWRWVVSAYVL